MTEKDNILESFEDTLTSSLLSLCTTGHILPGILLASPDIDGRWEWLAPDFIPQAVRDFNSYPEVVLAWSAYLGMAISSDWDLDWERWKDAPYSRYQDERGFDYMDEHITMTLLGFRKDSPELEALNDDMRAISSEALSLLRKSGVEAGTAEAYRAFLIALETMYRFGEAIQLYRLGYKLEKVSIS